MIKKLLTAVFLIFIAGVLLAGKEYKGKSYPSKIRQKDGMKMRLIPAGEFSMGISDAQMQEVLRDNLEEMFRNDHELLEELLRDNWGESLDEGGRKFYEPHAPSVQSRLEGIQRLRAADIPVSLRIDPLFPREPLPTPPWQTSKIADYGVKKTHSLNEIQQLVWFAANQGCQKVIVSPLKVPIGSRSKSRLKDKFRLLYAAPFAGKLRIQGFSMRLPEDYIKKHLIAPVRDICQAAGIPIQHCRHNLISTL